MNCRARSYAYSAGIDVVGYRRYGCAAGNLPELDGDRSGIHEDVVGRNGAGERDGHVVGGGIASRESRSARCSDSERQPMMTGCRCGYSDAVSSTSKRYT